MCDSSAKSKQLARISVRNFISSEAVYSSASEKFKTTKNIKMSLWLIGWTNRFAVNELNIVLAETYLRLDHYATPKCSKIPTKKIPLEIFVKTKQK